jgi:hypothetical protein
MVAPCSKTFYTPSYFRLFPLLADDVTKGVAILALPPKLKNLKEI